jgi:formylmethanofuran dehydrogenase subunit A
LIKDGEVVLDDGELRQWTEGRTLHVVTESDHETDPEIARYFESSSSMAFANYPIRDEEVANASEVGCGGSTE